LYKYGIIDLKGFAMAKIINFCDDYSLFDRYMCGDKDAGEQLCANAFPIVEKYVYSKTKGIRLLNNQDRDEIISESFCRSIDKKYDFKKGIKFSTFVIGFAKNVIKEKCREKLKSDRILHLEEAIGESDFDFINIVYDTSIEGKNPLDIIIKDYDVKCVQMAFKKLPKDYQDIITLRVFRKQKNVDIAKFSNQSPEATRSLYRRAITKLRENLSN